MKFLSMRQLSNSPLSSIIWMTILIWTINLGAWSEFFSIEDNIKQPIINNIEVQKGGSIRYAIRSDFKKFSLDHPESIRHAIIFDTLMRERAENTSFFYPLIADRYLLSEERDSIIFHIDERARWSDESKITADDILFSYQFYLKNFKSIKNIQSVELIDNNQIKFTFIDPQLTIQTIFNIIKIPIVPKIFYENRLNPLEFDKNNLPTSSGPYIITNFILGDFAQYKRNKNYWAKEYLANINRFNFNEIIFKYYQDPNMAARSLVNHINDLNIESYNQSWLNSYKKSPELIKKLVANKSSYAFFLILNQQNKYLQNPHMRQALNLLLDFPTLNQKLFRNSYIRLNSYFPYLIEENHYVSSKIMSKVEKICSEDVINSLYRENIISQTNILNSEQKLTKAMELLKKTGFQYRDGRLVDQNNEPVALEILLSSPSYRKFSNLITANANKIGINIDILVVDSAQHFKKLVNHEYDITIYGFNFTDIYDENISEYFHSEGKKNYLQINNSCLDNMLKAMQQEHEHNKKLMWLQAIDQLLINNHYAIPTWTSNSLRLVYQDKFWYPKLSPEINYYQYGFDGWAMKQE